MLEGIGWFAVAYACVSLTVTVLMLVFANRTFNLGGPIGMARTIALLVLAIIGSIIWGVKQACGKGSGESLDDEIKRTVRKTSSWIDELKNEWDDSKKK